VRKQLYVVKYVSYSTGQVCYDRGLSTSDVHHLSKARRYDK
jgi:hypothetical protein